MEHYKVYDKDGKLLVSDIAVSIKSDVITDDKSHMRVKFNLISFDTKYFINTNCFKFELINDNIINPRDYEFDRVKFDIKNFASYNVVRWRDNLIESNAPIYIDNTYDELDPEVSELVHTLNAIPAICTTGSCSGHNISPLFVTMNILDYDTILFLVNIINNYFCSDFHLTTDQYLLNSSFSKSIFMKLVSTTIGNVAYNKTKELVKIINENKDNIYPIDDLICINYDSYRTQIYDLEGNLLVDDIVLSGNRTTTTTFDHHFGYINKRLIIRHKYISFDLKHYIDISSKLFKFVFLEKITDRNSIKFDRIKFDIDKFKKYGIIGYDTYTNSDAPIRVELLNMDSYTGELADN